MRHVAIIVHRHAPLDGGSYWISAISECWLERGIRVSVVSDPEANPDADIAVLHVDLTVTPPRYLALAGRFPVTVNGGIRDISKRAISSNLLSRSDSWDGAVFVKTDRNCYGRPEINVAWKTIESRRKRNRWNYLASLKQSYRDAWRPPPARLVTASAEYRIFGSIAEVPDAVWNDTDFVVERFLPEMSNGLYCVRTWLFFGDQDRHAIFYSNDPIVKSQNVVGYERLADVPEELREIRARLRFDFGKFDYTMVDGRPVLFDANRTPAFGEFSKERYLPIARSLADGIIALS